MRVKSLLSLTGAAFTIALASASPASADVILPVPDCGLGATNNCLTFSDFTVYSLALLSFKNGDGVPQMNEPYFVKSVGNEIADAVVIGSHDANAVGNQGIASVAGKVDDAFQTPTGLGSSTANFQMTAGTEPTPTFTGDTAGLWNIQTSALTDYLNGGALTFFFNLNQVNSDNTYLTSGQDALGALDVIFTSSVGAPTLTFRLNGNDCGGGVGSCIPNAQSFAQISGVNDFLPNPTDQWAYIHGAICVTDTGEVLGFGTCAEVADQGIDTTGGNTVNQNLGAGSAAFALFSQGAQDALDSGLYDIMSVDLRMAAVDNGFEQLFILPTQGITIQTPEPLTISLLGAGLAGAVALRRRKAKKA
jgi:hypothetical protein